LDRFGGAASSEAVMHPFQVLERMLNEVDDDEEEMCTICFDEVCATAHVAAARVVASTCRCQHVSLPAILIVRCL